MIVYPLCRNTWKGSEGAYNDLLVEYAAECKKVGQEYGVPVLDLHKRSMDLITSWGWNPQSATFYPGDYTHTNDYGAWFMARCVAEEGCAAHLNAADADPLAGDPGPALPEEFTTRLDPRLLLCARICSIW